jgi:cell division protein FtsA
VVGGSKLQAGAGEAVGVLDVGTSKTVCLIVAAPPPRASLAEALSGATVLAWGVAATRGLKAGVVVDLDAVEHAVRTAVAQAERMIGVVLDEVFVAVACGRVTSSTLAAEAGIAARVVGDADVERLAAAGRSFAARDGRTLLHMNCLSYTLDGAADIADPRGLAAAKLGAALHIVSADDAPLQNLLQSLGRADLAPAGLVPAPVASSLAATSEEERRQGVIAIDMGAGTTGLAMFAEGHLMATHLLPVGGYHATVDIARAWQTSIAEAERIKTEYGTLAQPGADDAMVAYAPMHAEADGKGHPEYPARRTASAAQLRELLGRRMEGHFSAIARRTLELGFPPPPMGRVVLTGGASQLDGLSECVAAIMGRPVRVARMPALPGLPPQCCSPAFSTAVGLVHVAFDPSVGVRREGTARAVSYVARMREWLRESF